MEWQPIETAPDDERVLVWAQGFHNPVVAENSVYDWLMMGPGEHDLPCDGSPAGGLFRLKPTHWMPLPAPPKAP